MLVFLLLLAAVACFVLEAFGVGAKVKWLPLGLAFWAASFAVAAAP